MTFFQKISDFLNLRPKPRYTIGGFVVPPNQGSGEKRLPPHVDSAGRRWVDTGCGFMMQDTSKADADIIESLFQKIRDKPALTITEIDINYDAQDGCVYRRVGRDGVTRIDQTWIDGVPYMQVWKGDRLASSFCRHKIVGVHYAAPEKENTDG